MYLISAYFDEKTNKTINRYINRIAEKTGNTFMLDNHVPPHMTISALEARNGELLIPYFSQLEKFVTQGEIQFVSVGTFFPYVMYLTPILNEYLQELSKSVYRAVCDIPEVNISRFYLPMQWLPHVTLGKKLSKEGMQIAFEIMQSSFAHFQGTVLSIGLAKTNPMEDIMLIKAASKAESSWVF